MDLIELGELMEERRKAIGISRAELARRVSVSPSYVWMVENAKPRTDGEPSQPSRELLERWAKALGWDEPYAKQLTVLAGHVSAGTQPPQRLPFAAGALHFPQPKRMERQVERERLIQQLRELLDTAEGSDKQWKQVLDLLASYFEWLNFRLGGQL